jgi:hypothetical protein
MTIKELAEEYSLTEADFWKHKQSGSWIISHNACEKIAAIEGIELVNIEVLNSEWDFCRFLVTMKKDVLMNEQTLEMKEISITTVGEAQLTKTVKNWKYSREIKKFTEGLETVGNCTSPYPGAIAEKRGVDRCILKLINAYQYGIYSDSEADDFKKGKNK